MNGINKLIILCIISLFFSSNVYAEFDYKFVVETGNQLFPSLITTVQAVSVPKGEPNKYKIGDPSGVIGLQIKTDEYLEGKLTVTGSSFLAMSEIEFEIHPSATIYNIVTAGHDRAHPWR